MTTRSSLLLVTMFLTLTLIAVVFYFFPLSEEYEASTHPSNMTRFETNNIKVGLEVIPSVPAVGNNQILVELTDKTGEPLSATVEAYAEMPAMGSMPAMRSNASLQEISPGLFKGELDLSMRGEWPLTLNVKHKDRTNRLQFDFATDRKEIAIVSGGTPIRTSETDAGEMNSMPRYQTGDLEVAIDIEPKLARVGKNQVFLQIRNSKGEVPENLSIKAFAQMPAMGAMPAMRAPADLTELSPGKFEGTVELSMRGEWPMTLNIISPEHGEKRLQFDLATDREGLSIASGATVVGSNQSIDTSAQSITIDSRRQQLIGLKRGLATHRNLTKSVRALGRVTIDERTLSDVVLKFDGFIGDLNADFEGMKVQSNDHLFDVYSPQLLAAQQEYLESYKRETSSASQSTLLQAARQRLALWDISNQQIKQLEVSAQPMEYITIKSPRSGTIIMRNIVDGGYAKAGERLMTIADLSRVWIEAEVYEADLELVDVGMMARVTLSNLPGRSYMANVEFIYPYLDAKSRTGRIRLSLENPEGELKPDMYAEVNLLADIGHRLSVPEEAVIFSWPGSLKTYSRKNWPDCQWIY